MQHEQRGVNDSCCYDRLQNTDKGGLPSNFFELREPEFIAYSKGYEAQRNIGEKPERLNALGGDEAQTLYAEPAEQ